MLINVKSTSVANAEYNFKRNMEPSKSKTYCKILANSLTDGHDLHVSLDVVIYDVLGRVRGNENRTRTASTIQNHRRATLQRFDEPIRTRRDSDGVKTQL